MAYVVSGVTDLVKHPAAGRVNDLENGSYLVEVKCRSIKDPTAFDWGGVLAKESEAVCRAKIAQDARGLVRSG